VETLISSFLSKPKGILKCSGDLHPSSNCLNKCTRTIPSRNLS